MTSSRDCGRDEKEMRVRTREGGRGWGKKKGRGKTNDVEEFVIKCEERMREQRQRQR